MLIRRFQPPHVSESYFRLFPGACPPSCAQLSTTVHSLEQPLGGFFASICWAVYLLPNAASFCLSPTVSVDLTAFKQPCTMEFAESNLLKFGGVRRPKIVLKKPTFTQKVSAA